MGVASDIIPCIVLGHTSLPDSLPLSYPALHPQILHGSLFPCTHGEDPDSCLFNGYHPYNVPGPVLGWGPEVKPAWALFSSLVCRSKLISYPQPVSLSHDYCHHHLFLWRFLHPRYPLLSAPILQNLCSLLRFARVAFSIPPPLVFPFPPNNCNIPVLCSVAYKLNGFTLVTILGV